ncbi:MAG: HNH endonuclease [Spirochaetes bacterium]|nr:MAG: HNH endonuclease [Spirochaetota bacterium]
MKKNKIPADILKFIKSITNKRAKIVIDHIIKNEFITTEQLKNDYGYDHPPRAARDVRESGVPLETFYIKSKNGKNIAAYKFGDFNKINKGKLGGRKIFPKELHDKLYEENQGKCYICNIQLEKRYLQIDHRVPYEVAGDQNNNYDEHNYMLLCSSCNRAKSWSCEHCENWININTIEICLNCYWCHPDNYNHISMIDTRRLDITWQGEEVQLYNLIKNQASNSSKSLSTFVKEIIEEYIINK